MYKLLMMSHSDLILNIDKIDTYFDYVGPHTVCHFLFGDLIQLWQKCSFNANTPGPQQ